MEFRMKNDLNKSKVLFLLSLIVMVSGAITSMIGELAAPVCGAALAAIFIFDTTKFKYYFATNSILLIFMNVGFNFLYGAFVSLASAEIIAIALIIAICYTLYCSKAFSAALVTGSLVIFILAGIYLFGAAAIKNYSFGAVVGFYADYIVELRESFIAKAASIIEDSGAFAYLFSFNYSAETFGAVFDYFVDAILAFLLIFSFAMAGACFKLFELIVKAVSETPYRISDWRFVTSNVYAYFYIIINLVNIFVDNSGIIGVAIFSLATLFMFVYAYLGLDIVVNLLNRRIKRGLCWLIVIGALLTLSSAALMILSYFGVFATIRHNRLNGGNIIR